MPSRWTTGVSRGDRLAAAALQRVPGGPARAPARPAGQDRRELCTGGIRCEKAALVMREAGLTDVWQLEGGILKYFEQAGGAHFHGTCFVFDGQALDPALRPHEAGGEPQANPSSASTLDRWGSLRSPPAYEGQPQLRSGSGGVNRVGGSGMNSASPGTVPIRIASQAALASRIRSLRLDTKFHHCAAAHPGRRRPPAPRAPTGANSVTARSGTSTPICRCGSGSPSTSIRSRRGRAPSPAPARAVPCGRRRAATGRDTASATGPARATGCRRPPPPARARVHHRRCIPGWPPPACARRTARPPPGPAAVRSTAAARD